MYVNEAELAVLATSRRLVCYWGKSGQQMLNASLSASDPSRTSARLSFCSSEVGFSRYPGEPCQGRIVP
jgi:hypothetical protein